MSTVFGQVKLVGRYAARIEAEAQEGNVSQTALITHYAMRGIDAIDEAGLSELGRMERRLSQTLSGLDRKLDKRLDTVIAMVDLHTALLDTFVKLMLLHLPEPVLDELEAVVSSSQARYERFVKEAAERGYDQGRPRVLREIHRLLGQHLEDSEDAA
jgi:hypothetical protein